MYIIDDSIAFCKQYSEILKVLPIYNETLYYSANAFSQNAVPVAFPT